MQFFGSGPNKEDLADLNDDLEQDHHEESKVDIEALRAQVKSFSEEPSIVLSEKIDKAHASSEAHEKMQTNMSLADRLLNGGYITRDQLEIALREQKESSTQKELGTILVELNFITDQDLSKILAETAGVESVDLKSFHLDTALIRKIPKGIAIQYKILALDLEEDVLKIATSDVYNVLALDQLKKYFGKNIKVKIYYTSDFQISEAIDEHYDYDIDIQAILREIESGEHKFDASDDNFVNPTVRLVDSILMDAVKLGASDIHFEPEAEFVRVRYRIDGVLIEMFNFHKKFWSAIVVRVKVMSSLNIAETRNPQDGRITLLVMGRKVDFRVSSMPTIYGENVVMRILDKKKSLMPLTDLGLMQDQIDLIKLMLKRPEGIIIVTGPTGSGKTTTLYSVLSTINSMDINIMTLEDPVEYQLPIIRQSSIKDGTNVTFDNGVRSLMRQDPDVIFVGEVRDGETAGMTVRAAMTGHQVYTTLHTNDAIGAIPRLIDLGIKGSIIAGSIIGCIAQRLARRLCSHCKKEYVATHEECKFLEVDPATPPTLYKHVGCNKCFNTGYRGRIAIYEILIVDREFDDLIAREATRKEMLGYAKTIGFKTMSDEGVIKILQGITDIAEMISTVDMTERLRNVNLSI